MLMYVLENVGSWMIMYVVVFVWERESMREKESKRKREERERRER